MSSTTSTTTETPFHYPSTPTGLFAQTVCQPISQQFSQVPLQYYRAPDHNYTYQQTPDKDLPQISNSPLIYFVNDVPHYCYPHQSDILYPVYVPSDLWGYQGPQSELCQQFSVPNQRFIGEIAETVLDAAADAVKQELNKAEQQLANEVKTCCFRLCKC